MMINQMEKDHRSSSVVDTDEFDDEEAKMDKFYELIRSFNEARANHQRNLQQSLRQNQNYQVINHLNNNNNNNSNCQKNNGTKSLDNLPSFKWEDFRGVPRDNHDDPAQNQNQNRVAVSDKSGTDFLKNTSNFVEFKNDNNNNVINNKLSKKRKIVDVNVVDDGGTGGDDDGDYRDEEVNADKVKILRPQIELDLNLAL